MRKLWACSASCIKHAKANAVPRLWARGKAAWLDTGAALLHGFLEAQAHAAVDLPRAPPALGTSIGQAHFAATTPSMPLPPAAALVAQAAFDGSQYGADYLVLLPGEQVGIFKLSDKTSRVNKWS